MNSRQFTSFYTYLYNFYQVGSRALAFSISISNFFQRGIQATSFEVKEVNKEPEFVKNHVGDSGIDENGKLLSEKDSEIIGRVRYKQDLDTEKNYILVELMTMWLKMYWLMIVDQVLVVILLLMWMNFYEAMNSPRKALNGLRERI